MRKGIAVILFAALVLGSSVTVLAQGNSQKGRGGSDGESGDTPLIIVFRDADGDTLRNDDIDGDEEGDAYIHGESGIGEAILDENGDLWLQFLGGKKAPATARKFTVDLNEGVDPAYVDLAESNPAYAGRSGDGPPPDLGNGLVGGGHFYVSVDDGFGGQDANGNLPGIPDDGSRWARFAVWFDEPNSRNSWKLSYSSNTFDGPTQAEGGRAGEGLPLVHCVYPNSSGGCAAWVVEKESAAKQPPPGEGQLDSAGLSEVNRAALTNSRGNEPDAGEWIMPFALGVCNQEILVTEAACRAVLGGSGFRFPQP